MSIPLYHTFFCPSIRGWGTQNRNREKERKARTRRLIQEGAILEKTLPNITDIELDNLEDYLLNILKR